jgi:uncharacterized protein (DUF302 family)
MNDEMHAAPSPTALGRWVELPIGFDAAVERMPNALKGAGFGVITHIDIQGTFQEKLGVPFRRYRIFGACNPTFAHAALAHDLRIGVLLPCNVVVYEGDDGRATVGAVDPVQTLGAHGDEGPLVTMAREVARRLDSALDAMQAPQ